MNRPLSAEARSASERQPPALYLLFFVEMWERMSFYGMRALLVLYMTAATSAGGFAWSRPEALSIYGWYTGLVYLTPIFGGYMADRFLGLRKAITIGASIMMIGHISLAFTGEVAFYLGLGCLIIGNGFFKPSMATLVGSLYQEGDRRRDAAYTIFYVGVNTGAFIAPFISGTLGERVGFHWGFGAAAVGMFLGQVLFNLVGPRILGDIGIKPRHHKSQESSQTRTSLSQHEKDRLKVIFSLMIFVVIFWAAFEQAGGLMTLYTDSKVDRNLLGFEIPTTWFQSINPVFIMSFGPIFAWFWARLALKGREPSAPLKFGLALFLMGCGFMCMVCAAQQSAAYGKASVLWLIASYLLQTWAELCLSPVGLSMVNRLSPTRYSTLIMGIWYLSNAVANKLAGIIGGFAETLGETQLFGVIAATALTASAVLIFGLAKPLQKKMHGVS
ncbi:MAG: peptide MFS transporter [Proteobacteria bacterium]|nr:peptide MFS transporter [Pseudomonadota bacterium]